MTAEHERIAAAVRDGSTIDEAARHAEVNVHTVRRWLSEGRKRPDGTHGEFARMVDEARAAQRVELDTGSMTYEEIERRLTEQIRAGSLGAIKVWIGLHPQDRTPAEDDPFAEFEDQFR